MTNEDILNYVTETPGNTNRAVLSSMLNQLSSNNGGGGGSSDLSYATVTATYTLPVDAGTDEGLAFNGSILTCVESASSMETITFNYDSGYALDPDDLGSVNSIQIPVYKDLYTKLTSLTYQKIGGYAFWVDGGNSTVISGDAVIEDGAILVTGDCSINIALIYAN